MGVNMLLDLLSNTLDAFMNGVAGHVVTVVLTLFVVSTALSWMFASLRGRPTRARAHICIVIAELLIIWLIRNNVLDGIAGLDPTLALLAILLCALAVFVTIPWLLLDLQPRPKQNDEE